MDTTGAKRRGLRTYFKHWRKRKKSNIWEVAGGGGVLMMNSGKEASVNLLAVTFGINTKTPPPQLPPKDQQVFQEL